MRNKKEYALPALMLCIGVFLLPLPAYAECLSWLIQISSLWEELVFDGFMETGVLPWHLLPAEGITWERRPKQSISRLHRKG